jgi:hypothetical protein
MSIVCILKPTKIIFQQLIIETENAKQHLDLQIHNAYGSLAHKKVKQFRKSSRSNRTPKYNNIPYLLEWKMTVI